MPFDSYEYWKDWKPTKTVEECNKHNYIPRGKTYMKCTKCGDTFQRYG